MVAVEKVTISCYHHRPRKIATGKEIPPTIVADPNLPVEFQKTPLVWFIISKLGFYEAHWAVKRFVHRIELRPEDIIPDPEIAGWGATKAPAVVQEVWVEYWNPK